MDIHYYIFSNHIDSIMFKSTYFKKTNIFFNYFIFF